MTLFSHTLTPKLKYARRVKNHIFFKTIKEGLYLLKPPAIAFDVQSLVDAEQVGARMVFVKDIEKEVIYKQFISDIWEKGFNFNRGFGDQIGLELSTWYTQVRGSGLKPPQCKEGVKHG